MRLGAYLLAEITTSPVPLHFRQREPFLFRPEPRHLGHFLALMTPIQMYLWIKGKEYNTLRQGYKGILFSCYETRTIAAVKELRMLQLRCVVIIFRAGSLSFARQQ